MDNLDSVLSRLKEFFEALSHPLFQISGSKVSFFTLISSVLIIFVSFNFAKIMGRLANRFLLRKSVDSGVRDSIEKFIRYFLIAVGFLVALDSLGISISSLAAIGAVLMVGIGFGLQNIAQNFISGIIILIERPVKVGDIVSVGKSSGRIIDIRVRSTVIQTRDDITIIVPNSKLVSEEVINDSYSSQKIRQHIRVGVAYGSDVKLVKDLLRKAALSHEQILNDPAPSPIFEDFGDSALNFDLRFWSTDIWKMDQISSDIRTEIDRLFKEAQIIIPFPQRDLHIK